MKTSNALYFIGLLLIAISIFLLINDSMSGQSLMIAGGLSFIGFPLNVAGFLMKQKASAINNSYSN